MRIISPITDAYLSRYSDSGKDYYVLSWKINATDSYFAQFGTDGNCAFGKIVSGVTTVIKRW